MRNICSLCCWRMLSSQSHAPYCQTVSPPQQQLRLLVMVVRSCSILGSPSLQCFHNTQFSLCPPLQHTPLLLPQLQRHRCPNNHSLPQVLTLKTKRRLQLITLHSHSCHNTHSSLSMSCITDLFHQRSLPLIKTLLLPRASYLRCHSLSIMGSLMLPSSHSSRCHLSITSCRSLNSHCLKKANPKLFKIPNL